MFPRPYLYLILIACLLSACGPSASPVEPSQTATSEPLVLAATPRPPTEPPPTTTTSPTPVPTTLTAREGLETAQQQAAQWSKSAVLQSVETQGLSGSEYIGMDSNGRADWWEYAYLDPDPVSPKANLSYRVRIWRRGTMNTAEYDYGQKNSPLQVSNWALDSGEAALRADAAGGSQILQLYPEMVRIGKVGTRNGQTSWVVIYLPAVIVSGVQPPYLLIYLNAKTGAVEEINPKMEVVLATAAASGKDISKIPTVTPTTPPTKITAREGYPAALKAARAWNSDAMLCEVSTINYDGGGLDMNGRAERWSYLFSDRNAGTNSNGFGAVVTADGLQSSNAYAKFVDIPCLPDSGWTVDSLRALQVSEQNGGAIFKQRHPGTLINAYLRLGNPDKRVYKQVEWELDYFCKSDCKDALEFHVDAGNAQVLMLKAEDIAHWQTVEGITEQEGLAIALERAHAWSPGAGLVKIDTRDPFYRESAHLDLNGKSRLWLYEFVDFTAEKGSMGYPVYKIQVSKEGVEQFRTDQGYSQPEDFATSWAISAAQAVKIAEENGGAQLRQENPEAYIVPTLYTYAPWSGVDAPGARAIWVLWYGKAYEGKQFFIDADTGNLIKVK